MGGFSGSGALGGLLQGMLAGRQIRMQMQREAQQQEAARQEMSARDIQNRMLLSQSARPVSEMGTVSESVPGAAPAGMSPLPDFNYERKADKGRTVAYGGRQYELMTPEEQNQRRAGMEVAARQATGVRVDPEAMGIPGMQPFYEAPEHAAQILSPFWHYGQLYDPRSGMVVSRPGAGAAPQSSSEIVDSMLHPEAENAAPNFQRGGVPAFALPSYVRSQASAASTQARKDIAAQNNTTRAAIADKNREAAGARSAASNATREKIANARLNKAPAAPRALTPGQEGVQRRFHAKQEDADRKAADTAQAEEQKQHAIRSQIGALLTAWGTHKDAEGNDFNAGAAFVDPATGKAMSMNAVQAGRLRNELDKATKRVQQLQDQQKEIRQKHGWGEFAPGAGAGVTMIQPDAGTVPHQNAAGQVIVAHNGVWVDQKTGQPVQ